MLSPLKNTMSELLFYKTETDEHSALFTNLTQQFLLDDCWRMCNEQNNILTGMGDTGSSKSMTFLIHSFNRNEFCRTVLNKDVKFDIDNICFSRAEVVKLIPTLKSLETSHLDEDNEYKLGIGSFLEWSTQEREEKTLRSTQKNFNNLSPELRYHNETWILKTTGINSNLNTSKSIIRERERPFLGFVLTEWDRNNSKFNALINKYLSKKKQNQDKIEKGIGESGRLKRVLEMATEVIKSNDLTYDKYDLFDTFISAKFKLDLKSMNEIKRWMKALLDYRVNLTELMEYKEQIRYLIHEKK